MYVAIRSASAATTWSLLTAKGMVSLRTPIGGAAASVVGDGRIGSRGSNLGASGVGFAGNRRGNTEFAKAHTSGKDRQHAVSVSNSPPDPMTTSRTVLYTSMSARRNR